MALKKQEPSQKCMKCGKKCQTGLCPNCWEKVEEVLSKNLLRIQKECMNCGKKHKAKGLLCRNCQDEEDSYEEMLEEEPELNPYNPDIGIPDDGDDEWDDEDDEDEWDDEDDEDEWDDEDDE